MSRPDLSLVMPAFNEESDIEAAIRGAVACLQSLPLSFEVVVVNDGSADATGRLADRTAKEVGHVRVLHQENRGIGGAFRTGVESATGRYIALWPVDMPCTATFLRPFTDAMGRADVIVGCRKRRVGYNPLMEANARIYPHLVAALFHLRLRDVNWICLYDGDLLRSIPLTQSGIPMLAEILVRLRDRGATFLEVDVEMVSRTSGKANAARPKVMWRTLTGLLTLYSTWRNEPRLDHRIKT